MFTFSKLRSRRLIGALMMVSVGGCAAIAYAKWSHAAKYPFGTSHCCDKALYLSLHNYASNHDGAFPTGESSPEASLSLLYQLGTADANLLRGKSVPEATVQKILNEGGLLSPNTCGWHYVEGLRNDDDGRFALFWDKEGLDHNGGRLKGGGHIVWYINGDHPYVTAEEWPKFLAEQEELYRLQTKTASDHDNQ